MKRIILTGLCIVVLLSLLVSCAAPPQNDKPVERTGVITLEGKPLTLLGDELKVGQKAPDFSLVPPYDRVELSSSTPNVSFSGSQGKVRLISVVPSLDTPVCDLQTQRFEQEAVAFDGVTFYTISMDLPFAQARYCGLKNISRLEVLSDYRDGSFGIAYGVLIKELRLLARSIFVIDANGTVQYVEYVKEISQAPDYIAALAAVEQLAGPSTSTIPVPTTSPTTAPTTAAPTTTVPTTTTQPTTTAPVTGIKVGNLAPDFTLNNLNGEPVSLSGLRGKPVLINFWATWCSVCVAERPRIQQLSTTWQAKGLEILTVDLIGTTPTETPENITNFMKNNNYTFTVLLDVDKTMIKNYGLAYTPTNFLIDRNGIIREVRIGAYASEAAMEEALNKLLQY